VVDVGAGLKEGESPAKVIVTGTVNFATSFAIDLAVGSVLADAPLGVAVLVSIGAYNLS
jgi:hypothetical protein